MSILVVEFPKPRDVNQERREAWEAYRKLHKACPNCGATSFETTTIGYMWPPDNNHVTCLCGFRGKVNDLVGE